MRLLRGYIAMIPRIRAEESIRRVSELRIAAGNSDSAAEVWEAWLKDAGIEHDVEAEADSSWF